MSSKILGGHFLIANWARNSTMTDPKTSRVRTGPDALVSFSDKSWDFGILLKVAVREGMVGLCPQINSPKLDVARTRHDALVSFSDETSFFDIFLLFMIAVANRGHFLMRFSG